MVLAEILAAQRQAFAVETYPSLAVRLDRLRRLADLIETNAPAFQQAISEDFGYRAADETKLLELAPLMGEIRHARAHLKRWMRQERRASALEFFTFRNRVFHQPLGVVGIMVPWNYPLLLALGPLVDVLSAGNRAMIKPSERLPKTAAVLQAAVAKHFSPEEVAVITGDVQVAAEFSALPFDHLVFTGSTAVGRKVMAAAATNLTPVTLELGGKSPTIVMSDYPLQDAARAIAFGKLMNAGQTCIAPDYVLVPRDRLEAMADAILARMTAIYPAKRQGRDYSSLCGEADFQRLAALVDACRQAGCRILTVDTGAGGRPASMAPTLIIDPPLDSAVMEEEIFGPVLPIVPYDRLEDAIAFVNARPRPLALYLFSDDAKTQNTVLQQTHSGNVTINGTLLHIAQNSLPFGGIGPSGMGAYHGEDGFKRFSHARGVAQVRLFNPARLATPPYGWVARLLQWFMMRRF